MIRRGLQRGFTILELMTALMIAVTVLVALQAVVGGAILAAGDAITQREARERARMKLEEVLAGITPPNGGGSFEDAPQLKWSVKAEPKTVGMPDQGGQSQVRIVTLTLSFPTNAREGGGADDVGDVGDGGGTETITLAGIMAMDEGQ